MSQATSKPASDSAHEPASAAPEECSSQTGLEIVKEIETRLKGALPPQQQSKVSKVIKEAIVERQQFFSGPQPPPELLAQYEQVCPGWATKLLQMGIDEQKHRHEQENRLLDQGDHELKLMHRDATYSLAALVLGFIAFLVIALLGYEAMRLGHATIAITLFTTFSIGVIGTFIKGRPRSGNSLPEKPPAANAPAPKKKK